MDVQPALQRQPGYSLIEVLIALLVLSIGMLGIAGMFLATLKDTRGAFNRTKAVALAWDMAERIRTNPTAQIAYEADEAATGTDGSCSATAANTEPQKCDAGTLAAHDIFEWKTALSDRERGLPEGTGSIDFDNATSPPTYTITVTWSDGMTDAGEANAPFVRVVTQL